MSGYSFTNFKILICSAAVLMFSIPAVAGDNSAPAANITPTPAPIAVTGGSPAPATAINTAPTPKDTTATGLKIGYIDVNRIAQESNFGKEVNARLAAKAEKYKKDIAAKQRQLEKEKKAIEAQAPILTQEQRIAKAKAFDKKVSAYKRFVEAAEKDMQSMQIEAAKSIDAKIRGAAQNYGAANHYAAIVEKRELFYYDGTTEVQDITDEIIKLVDTKEQK
ncbi:MAG: OmpH family outer membrane protein [Desulfuromonadales bacterium]|nr:OmpH family outer membrane protein [Desulfuromonadales bacterium]